MLGGEVSHPMGTISADRPWDHIIIDLIGQLKASERGFVFILIIVDVFNLLCSAEAVEGQRGQRRLPMPWSRFLQIMGF